MKKKRINSSCYCLFQKQNRVFERVSRETHGEKSSDENDLLWTKCKTCIKEITDANFVNIARNLRPLKHIVPTRKTMPLIYLNTSVTHVGASCYALSYIKTQDVCVHVLCKYTTSGFMTGFL